MAHHITLGMAILLHDSVGDPARVNSQLWTCQCTFETPYRDPTRFVETAFSMFPHVVATEAAIHEVIFTPRSAPPPTLRHMAWRKIQGHSVLRADSLESSRVLLIGCLSEWVDFTFTFEGAELMIYADHDKFSTYFGRTQEMVDRVSKVLVEEEIRLIDGYRRLA